MPNDPQHLDDYELVDAQDGPPLMLKPAEAHLYRLTTGEVDGPAADVRVGMEAALKALGRLRANTLTAIGAGVDPTREAVPLDAVRRNLRDRLTELVGKLDHYLAHDAAAHAAELAGLSALVNAYVRLGGDLELTPAPRPATAVPVPKIVATVWDAVSKAGGTTIAADAAADTVRSLLAPDGQATRELDPKAEL